MPSASLRLWTTDRAARLNEIEAAHSSVGGIGRGRRYATQQINHAYVVLLSSEFQGFCRDLHSECVRFIALQVTPVSLQTILRAELLRDLKLKSGNANPSSLGSDFGRLGIEFWKEVQTLDKRNKRRQNDLEELNRWRNAVAHQDFDPAKLGSRTAVRLSEVKQWRAACSQLAEDFDDVVCQHITLLTGTAPW